MKRISIIKGYLSVFLVILFLVAVDCDKDSRTKKCNETVDNYANICPNQRYQELCSKQNLKRLYKGQNYVEFNQEMPATLYYQLPRPDSYMFMIKICAQGIQNEHIRVTALKQSPRSWGQPKAEFELIEIVNNNFMFDDYEEERQKDFNKVNCQVFSPQNIQHFQLNKDCSTQLLTIILQKPGSWWFTKSQLGVRVYFQIYGVDQISSIVAGTGLIMICLLICCCLCITLAVVKLIQSIMRKQESQAYLSTYANMQGQVYNNPTDHRYHSQNIPMGIQMNQMGETDSKMQAKFGQYIPPNQNR